MNAFLNGIKQCTSILFPLITFPYISRALGAESYGIVNFSYSIVSYIALIAALGVNNYAIREGARIKENKSSLEKTVNEIFTLNIYSTIISYLILLLLLFCWNKLYSYRSVILVMSSYILFRTLGCDWINTIYEDYTFLTVRYIILHIISTIALFLFVDDSSDYVIYAFIYIFPELVSGIFNCFHIRKKFEIHPSVVFSQGVLKHLKPIIIIFGSSIATMVYINSDTIILGIFTSDLIVGYYSVAAKIYTIIKQMFNAFLVVAIPRFSSEVDSEPEKLHSQLNKILNMLIAFIFPSAVGIVCLNEEIILLVSGSEYLGASQSLTILGVSLIFAVLSCFYINLVMLPNRLEKQILIATIVSAIVNIVLNVILIPIYGDVAAALTTLLSEFLMLAFGMYYTHSLYKFKCIKSTLVAIISSVCVFIVCNLVKCFVVNNIFTVLVSIIGSGICYFFIVLIIFRRIFISFCSDTAKRIKER